MNPTEDDHSSTPPESADAPGAAAFGAADEFEKKDGPPQPVWTYRGYQLRGSEFTTAMVHLFRAEVQRANVWRQRLDTTTNWAVITTGALLSFIFGTSETPHLVILINILLVTIFLVIEARRYRYYELWSYRVRLMETDFFAPMLVPPFHPAPDWAEALAENLLHPQFPISNMEALGRRLRRNYLAIYIIIAIAWLSHLWWRPVRADTWFQFVANARFQGIAGEIILLSGVMIFIFFITIALLTIPLQHASGEVFPRFPGLSGLVGGPMQWSQSGQPDQHLKAWFRPSHRRTQLMTLIITDQAKAITDRILKEMRRGVTAMPGKGMYTGEEHSVLLCALTITEIHQLRSLINEVDPKAFVIVTPAQEIFGQGFVPLDKDA